MRFGLLFLCFSLFVSDEAVPFEITRTYLWRLGNTSIRVLGLRSTDYTFDQSWDFHRTITALHAQRYAARALDFAYREYLERYQHQPRKRDFYTERLQQTLRRVRETGLALEPESAMAVAFDEDGEGPPIGIIAGHWGQGKTLLSEELQTPPVQWLDGRYSRRLRSDHLFGKLGPFVVKAGRERYVSPLLTIYLRKLSRKDTDQVLVCFRGESGMEATYTQWGASTVAYLGADQAVMVIPRGTDAAETFVRRRPYQHLAQHGTLYTAMNLIASRLSFWGTSCPMAFAGPPAPIEEAFMSWVEKNLPSYF